MTVLRRFNGARLALFMGEAKLTDKAMSEGLALVGIKLTPKTIGNWRNGKGEPNASELEALAQILDKDKDDFYFMPPSKKDTTGAIV